MQLSTRTRLLVLDLGGVLIELDFNHAIEHWSEQSGVEAKAISAAFGFDEAFKAYEVDAISTAEYLAHLRTVLALSDLDDPALVAGWNRIFERVDTKLVEVIEALRRSGMPVIGMTNTNRLHETVWREMLGEHLSAFDALYTSVELKRRKPSPEFFYWVCRRYSVAPDELLFVDDQWDENVMPARNMGIRTLHYVGVAGLLRDLGAAGWPVGEADDG